MPGSGEVIDRFLISLGLEVDSSQLDTFKAKADEATSSLLRIGTFLTAAFTGLAVKAIANIGSTFEQNQIQIAGFLSGLGITSDFNAGLKEADRTLTSITNAAAKLPGEAEEYVTVFKAALPFLKKAIPGGSVDAMTEFTNQLTAIGKATGGSQMSAEQIGRESKEMLADQGRAHNRNVLFANLLPFMQQVEGQAKLTDKAFNAMSAPKRVQLMQAAFAKMQPMLDASADSFDAMAGAIKSSAQRMVRLSTVGIFKGMKDALGKINGMFFNLDGTITDLGKHITEVGQRVSRWVVQVATASAALVSSLANSKVAMGTLKVVAIGLGIALAGLAFEKVAGGIGTLLASLLNLKRLLTGGLFLAIGLVAEDLYVFYTGGESVTGMLVEKFGPAAKYIADVVLVALAGALAYVNREAIGMAIALARPLLPLLALAAGVVGVIALWRNFGEKGRAAMVFVGAAAAALFVFMKRAAIQTAIGFALMNLPIILLTGSIVALGVAIYETIHHWDDFSAGAKVAIVAVTTVLGVLAASFAAAQAAAIASGVASAAAWVAAGLPIAAVIVGVGLLAVGLYELVKHWDEVKAAILDATDAMMKFLHISDDFSHRKGLTAAEASFNAKTKGFERKAPEDELDFLKRGKRGHKVSLDPDADPELGFLRKKAPAAGGTPAPATAPAPGGIDFAGMFKDMAGGSPQDILKKIQAAAGMPGAAGQATPPFTGPPDFLTATKGGGGTTVQHRDVHIHGDVKTDVHTDDPERVGRDVNSAILKNLDSPVDY